MAPRARAPGAAFLAAACLKESGRDPGLLEPEAWALGAGWSHGSYPGDRSPGQELHYEAAAPPRVPAVGRGACAWHGVSWLSQPLEEGLHLGTGPRCKVPASEL